jgi:hypothetical protein
VTLNGPTSLVARNLPAGTCGPHVCDANQSVGLTFGLSKTFMEQWFAQNKGSDLIENQIVFYASSAASVKDEAKDYPTRTNWDPISPPKEQAPWEKPKPPDDPRLRTLGNSFIGVSTAPESPRGS